MPTVVPPSPYCVASRHRKNSEDVALLPAREASARYPQMVINFYEQKLTWHCGDEEQ